VRWTPRSHKPSCAIRPPVVAFGKGKRKKKKKKRKKRKEKVGKKKEKEHEIPPVPYQPAHFHSVSEKKGGKRKEAGKRGDADENGLSCEPANRISARSGRSHSYFHSKKGGKKKRGKEPETGRASPRLFQYVPRAALSRRLLLKEKKRKKPDFFF